MIGGGTPRNVAGLGGVFGVLASWTTVPILP